jgi:hypothetical protein
MKKIALALVVLAAIAGIASAHETKKVGTLSILYHTGQVDEPAAGQPETLYFSFEDESGKFRIEDCECSATVEREGRVVASVFLDVNEAYGANVGSHDVVFPELGVYKVRVDGKSKTDKFSPFQVSYDRRVEKQAEQPAATETEDGEGAGNDYLTYGLAALAGLAIIFGIIKFIRK